MRSRRFLLALSLAGHWACAPRRKRAARILRVAASLSGRFLAAADDAGRVWVMETTGRRVRELMVTEGQINDIRFSPDGRILAVAAREMTLWPQQDREQAGALTAGGLNYGSAAFLPRGDALATVDGHGEVTVLDCASGRRLWSRCCSSIYGDAAVDPEGSRIITAGHLPRVWDARTGRLLGGLIPERSEPAYGPVAISRDGKSVWIGCQDGILRQWDIQSLELRLALPAQPGWIESIEMSFDGNTVAFTVRDRGIHVWNGRLSRLPLESPTSNVVFDAEGKRLLAGFADGRVSWVDLSTGATEDAEMPLR